MDSSTGGTKTGLDAVLDRAWLRRRRLEGTLVLCVLGAVMAATVWVIGHGVQMTWDEAVYATKARSLATAIPPSHWLLYRPPGLPYLGLVAAPFGYSDVSLRLVSAAAGVGVLAAAWVLARVLWGASAGVLTLLVLATTPDVLNRLPGFRNDLVSVGPVLLLLLLMWWQLERRHAPNAFLLAAGPLAAASFYLRYGSLSLLVGVASVALLLWGGKLWRHRVLVGATVLFAFALLIPHVLQAMDETGSPLGIVRSAAAVADTTGPARAAVRYLVWLPTRIAGPVGFVFAVAAGVIAVAVGWSSIKARRMGPEARRLALVLVPAAVGAIGIILVSHAEARYMVAPIILATIAGARGIAEAVRRLAPRLTVRPLPPVAWTAAIVAALILADGVLGGRWIVQRVRAAQVQWLAEAGTAIAADANGACLAIATRVPIIGWYSGCLAVSFNANLARTQAQMAPGTPTYVVFAAGDETLGQPGTFEHYRSLTSSPPIATVVEGSGTTTVYRLPP